MIVIYVALAVGLVDALAWGIFVQPQVVALADAGATPRESFVFFTACTFWMLLLDLALVILFAWLFYSLRQKRTQNHHNERVYSSARDQLRLAEDEPQPTSRGTRPVSRSAHGSKQPAPHPTRRSARRPSSSSTQRRKK